MNRTVCARSSVRGARMLAPLLAVSLAGCGLSNARRYDAMLDDYRRTAPEDPSTVAAGGARRFQEGDTLDRDELVQAVLAQNPSIESSRAAWRAALARYPQATSLEDPMLSYSFAPLSLTGDVPYGQRIELSQRLPFPGKRGLRGDVALAEAEAAKGDVDATRLELALITSRLYDDYFVAARAIEINEQHTALLRDLKASAVAQYVAGRAAQQDALQAEVELTHLERQRIMLETERDLAVEQVNGLLHRAPELSLPPPPKALPIPPELEATLDKLDKSALERRPELAAERARIRAGEAAVALAEREYFPDFVIMTSYSSVMRMWQHQWMLGVALNVPIQLARRRAAVDEAEARIARARSEYARKADAVRVHVAQSVRRLRESRHIVRLYESRLLPAARDQVESARAGFIAGQNSFLAVIEAQKNLLRVELQFQEAQADQYRRLADVTRAVGDLAGSLVTGGAP